MNVNYKVYIEDLNGHWIDFSDRLGVRGRNKVVDIGTIKHLFKKEDLSTSFMSSNSSIILDNSDGFFDDANAWSNLVSIDNTPIIIGTDLKLSTGKREVKLKDLKCKVKAEVLQSTGVVIPYVLGVFLIQEVTTSDSSQAILKLKSLETKLREANAAKVKNGRDWYVNRSVVFLIKQLLLSCYNEDGVIPTGFSLPTALSIPSYNGKRFTSVFGRPPDYLIGSLYVPPEYKSYSSAYNSSFK